MADEWAEGIRICHTNSRKDLIETVLVPSAKEATDMLVADFTERKTSYLYCFERLNILRKLPDFVGIPGMGEGNIRFVN